MAAKVINYDANEAARLQGEADLINHCFAYADSLAIRAAVELRIADIIHAHGKPMSLPEIASKFESSSPDISCLERVMRLLVRKKIFTLTNQGQNQSLYGLTPTSKLLLRDYEYSLAPMFLTFTHTSLMSPWHEIGRSIKEGGTPFEKAHGETFWEKGSREPEFNDLFNSGMVGVTKTTLNAILQGYKDGFSKLDGTLVDVGGGMGKAVADIVKAHPHIKGINFDQPHVVATAPQYSGVTHVGGDLFKEVPKADTVFLKSVLHDWGDEDCIKILKNCQKAVSEKKGKVIIVDSVLRPEGNELFDDAKIAVDLLMMAVCVNGKERTESDWKNLLTEAGFGRFNIIYIPSLMSIIEAYLP